ncbi:MAG TPA: hypothetical protein VFT91_09245 [Dehalococcoidia bacterium]|nr:hypothetical protein [Dehalococcoidia bacterium]
MAVSPRNCYSAGLLHRCQEAAVGVCQYCGRPFCPEHGDLLDQGQEVCQRPWCQKKVGDLHVHQSYLSIVRDRNAQALCGLLNCRHGPWGQCSHCEALFCQSHLHARLRTVRREGLPVTEPVSLCDHCWQRHRLWARV